MLINVVCSKDCALFQIKNKCKCYFCVVFCCHFGNSVEKTAVILSHIYVIGLKIVLRVKGWNKWKLIILDVPIVASTSTKAHWWISRRLKTQTYFQVKNILPFP